MEGGVAIILLLVLAVVVLVGGVALYLTGGAILFSGDKDGGEGSHRPKHKRPTDPVQENREFVGVHHDGDDEQR
jgi:hypothetical protein